jgi:hypothetical protein
MMSLRPHPMVDFALISDDVGCPLGRGMLMAGVDVMLVARMAGTAVWSACLLFTPKQGMHDETETQSDARRGSGL